MLLFQPATGIVWAASATRACSVAGVQPGLATGTTAHIGIGR